MRDCMPQRAKVGKEHKTETEPMFGPAGNRNVLRNRLCLQGAHGACAQEHEAPSDDATRCIDKALRVIRTQACGWRADELAGRFVEGRADDPPL